MNFVLVPGAGGQALYWHRVIPELQRVGHKGVPVDLPAADASCGLREYANKIIDSTLALSGGVGSRFHKSVEQRCRGIGRE